MALVIGNGAYKIGPLKNPANDARDMAATLRGLGFEVVLRENASLAQMEQAVDQFWSSLSKGGTGLFFFAGHGLQVNGRNYLVPVDANIQAEQDVKVRCLDVNLVLGRMENAGNPLNMVILDACRNNPFARAWRNAGQGLAKMDAPMGTLIAYATAPDSVAADGAGRNGVYTGHLLRHLRMPGLTIENVLKQTRIAVLNETGKKQIPWESSSLTGDFYFAGPGAAPQPQQLAMAPAPQQAPPPADGHKVGDTWSDPVTGMEFVWVPGGEFEMGCGPWTRDCDPDEKPVHTVRLSGFWMATYPVTQGQWGRVMGNYKDKGSRNPSGFKRGGFYPVEMVGFISTKEFIAELNKLGSAKFRLPTEAEWEYAARSGGKPEKYAGGSDLDSVGWYEGNSGGSTHEVGAKAPNGLGLYDMSGNVWQWCEDVYGPYQASVQVNPVVAADISDLSYRVVRGGSWFNGSRDARASRRSPSPPQVGTNVYGFRLVRVP